MVVRPTIDHSVTLTATQSSSSSPSNLPENIMASSFETPSWSKMYGQGERRCMHTTKYGRMSSYEPSSIRIKNKYAEPAHQSRADNQNISTSYRSRVSSSVDRDVGSEGLHTNKSYGRRAYSVDRDVGSNVSAYGSTTKVRPWREKLKIAEKKRRVADRGELECALRIENTLRRSASTERSLNRSSSYEATTSTRPSRYEVDSSLESRYETAARKSRASSISRISGDKTFDYESIIANAEKRRAASVSRLDEDYDVLHRSHHSSSAAANAIAATGFDVIEHKGNTQATMASFEDHIRRGKDISTFVFRPGETFEPEHMKVIELSSGRKARTYTTFNQYGHGDNREANNKINEVSLRTKILEQSMSTLEDFVRRNRSYFPEETTIYQQIRFYQLNQDQLREIGEHPDAEVYGVKVREKLVVPPGTDIGNILSKYYKSSDVDVEHSSGVSRQVSGSGESYEQVSMDDVQSTIRRQVEAEFELRDKQHGVGQESYECRAASAALNRQGQFNHITSHVTPTYLHTIYRDAGMPFDDIYQRSGTSTLTSPTASITSDMESIRSSVSSRRRTYDQVPHFTAKLRNKQCMVGQSIKFNCSVSGLPFPEITWFKGNRAINEGRRYTFINNYGLLSLEIQAVTKEDAGLYSVKAINNEGEVATSASLDVIEVDVSDRSERGSQKPNFIVEAANTAAEVGSRAIFEARATGRPTPTFRWYRDNILVCEGSRVKIYEDAQGNTKLVLTDLRPEDSGLYFLTAENHAGKSRCAATLRVVESGHLRDERRRSLSAEPRGRRGSWSSDTTPTLDLGPRPVRGNKPWFIQQPPVEMTVREGEALTLKCMVDGDPKPVVTWCKGVRELQYTERHRVLTEGDHYMMQIKATTQYDRGQYIVVAENAVGRIHANCWVNVLPFGEEGEVEDIEFKQYKIELPEMDLEAVTTGKLGKQAPMFVKRLPRERTVSAGSSLELYCLVREATPEVIEKTEYSTKVTGKVELKEETIRIGADGTITKKTEVIDLEGKGKPPLPPKAATPKAQEKPAAVEASVPVSEAKPEDVVVPVPTTEAKTEVVAEVKTEVKADAKAEVKVESSEIIEEVVQPVVIEKPKPVFLEEKALSPEPEYSPTPEVSAPEPEAMEAPTAPGIVEEIIEPVMAEKIKEVIVPVEPTVEQMKPTEPVAAPEPATPAPVVAEPMVTITETPPETVAMEVEPTPTPVVVAKTKPEPMDVEAVKPITEVRAKEPMEVAAPDVKPAEPAPVTPTPAASTAMPEPSAEIPKTEAVVGDSKPADIDLKEIRSSSMDSQSSVPDTPSSPKGNDHKSESEGGLPVFVDKLRNIMVPAGATTTFSCTLNNNSNAAASWTKDGEAVTSRTNLMVASDGCTHTVTISGVTKADEGCYTCTGSNRNGTATTSGTLSVEKSITKGYISALDQPEEKKKKKDKKDKKDKKYKNGDAEKPAEKPVSVAEETKPTEQGVQETIEDSKTSQPQDSEDSEDSESDSDGSDDDSSTISISSADSESDSEVVSKQNKQKQANSRRISLKKFMSPRLSALPQPHAVISYGRHISTDPLLETSWLCEGRQ